MIPEEGQIVTVRERQFVVIHVMPSELPASVVGTLTCPPQHLVALSSVEDEGLGEELQVIWELEPGAMCREKSQLPPLTDFDPPRYFDAFLDAVSWGVVSQADTSALQSPFRSGVEVEDYQLDPVVRAISMPRVNLLIADDVGLGKTIEAGLVAQELTLRHRVRSILIVCPSSIQIQWREEMRDKFGLEFRIVDTELLRDLRRRRGLHVNPWTHFPRLITSMDFVKRERSKRLFRESLKNGDAPTYPRPYDLLIVDEAHNVAPSGKGKYATDSQRTQAIQMLTPHFEHKLFLSATPHNGYTESFTALLELLDNQRFARSVRPNPTQLEAVMVRRMKSELELKWNGSRRFAVRNVLPLEVDYTDAEKKAHLALKEYAALRVKQSSTESERVAAEFVLKLLKKRLFSSPAAFEHTLNKHIQTVSNRKPVASDNSAWQRQMEEAEDDFFSDEEKDEAELSALEAVSKQVCDTSKDPRLMSLLNEMGTFAQQAVSRNDSKAAVLMDWLKTNLKPNGTWNNTRVIIFTEYRATQNWLKDMLAAYGFADSDRMKMIYGGMDIEDREAVKAAFQAKTEESAVRILLATDAASEGLNLQNHCWQLIHYEIPWNPNRMEQRNGRIDRHGQRNPEVRVFHFVGKGFNQAQTASKPGDLECDLEFLYRAAIKIQNIREDLGKVGPVIAEQVEEAMMGKRTVLDTARAEKDAGVVRKMLKFERDLSKQLAELVDKLRVTKQELRLEPSNIKNIVDVGLALLGCPPLKDVTLQGLWPDPEGRRHDCPVFEFPHLPQGWNTCAAGIAHPHTGVMRPIVFDHAIAAGRDDVVLCHLNHRMVQMFLRLLRAEIWSKDDRRKLNRFTARMVSDTTIRNPVVIIHGRLLVLGGDNHRVHEEIIRAGGIIEKGRFRRLNVGETRAAWNAATEESVPGYVEDVLKAIWPKISDSATSALEARMTDRISNLQNFLNDRSEKEVENLTAVMKELARSISELLKQEEDPQMHLDLRDATEIERSQRETDLGELRTRLTEIPKEIVRETEHLRGRYRNPTPRLFPVAVTFLVPPSAIAALEKGSSR